jgi:hypothetical protein
MTNEFERMVYRLYCSIADSKTYEKWANTPVPAFDMKSASQMINEGNAQKVIDKLEKLAKGGYM